jgi:hypothetical protein
LAAYIKNGRLEWLGHVIGMDQTEVATKFFKVNQQVEEKWEGPD